MPQQRFRRLSAISALTALLLSPALIAFAASLIPGTPVSIASVNGVINSIATLDSSHVVVAYQDTTNSNSPKVAICSISGTTPTCGTPVTVAAVATSALGVTALDSTHIAVAYRDNTNGSASNVVICSVSGTTPTCDSPVTFAAVVGVNYFASALDSTHVGIFYQDGNNSSHPTVVICSVSGTTPTCGTPVSVASVTSDHQSSVALDSTHFAVVYRDQSNGLHATVAICSVLGITPTCGTTVASTVAGLTPSLARLDNTHFALAYRNFSATPNVPTVQLCSVTGTTPSCGAAAAIAPNSSVYTSIIAIDSTHLAVAYQDITNSNRPTVVTCFISGSAFSCDPATVLAAVASTYTAATVVDSTHIAVMYQDTTNGSHPTLVVSGYAPISAPTVTTQSASSIGRTTATANGNITSDGGATITVRGFTYGTSANLTSGTATTTDSGSYGAGAFTGSLAGLTCNTMYYTRSYATNSAGTGFGSISSSFTTNACTSSVTPVTISSGNSSTTLATTGNIVMVTFTSDQTSLVSPTVSIAGHATTTATNTSGNTWTASTAMASDDIEGAVRFFITVGSSDGLATTSVSAITSGSNVTFDKTAPVITVLGSNPDTKYQSTAVYSDAGASATDGHDGTVSVVSSGSVNLMSPGSYTITYTTTDAAGNSSSAARTVTVLSSGGNGPPVGSLSVTPVTSGNSIQNTAATGLSNDSTIAALKLRLDALRAQLTALKGTTPVSSTANNGDLRLGSSGANVTALQIFLNGTHGPVVAKNGPGSPGHESNFFGSATYRALIKFQKDHNLPPTGYYGPLTRAVIAQL